MSKHNKHNKAYDESLYYRGSKTLKQSRHKDYDNDGMFEIYDSSEKYYENPKDKRTHKNKYRKTYKSDIEDENDYDSDTRSEKYGRDHYSQSKYKKDKRSKYSSERDLNQRTHSYKSKYQPSETGTVTAYDSDSDYSQWETPTGRGESYYKYRKQYSRPSDYHKGQRKHPLETTDTERGHYRRYVDVYADEQPRGQNHYKRKERKLSDDKNDKACSKGQRSQRRHSQDTTDTERSTYQSDVSIYAAELPRAQNPYRYKRQLAVDNIDEASLKSQTQYTGDTTDTEGSNYRTDVDVYAAKLPRGHNHYMDKWIESKLSEAPSETETQQTDGYSQTTALQSEHQVYVASKMPNNTAFSQERLISVIDYNTNTSPLQQKHINNTDANISEFVYVPVIYQNELSNKQCIQNEPSSKHNIQNEPSDKQKIQNEPSSKQKIQNEPSSKENITSSKSKLEEPKDKEPLQNNISVFVAGNLQQENIFEQSHNTKQKEQSPSDKKKSTFLTFLKRNKSKKNELNVNENEYPVKKSYINVVTSDHKSKLKSKSPEPKGSQCTISASKRKKQGKESTEVEFCLKKSSPNVAHADQNHNKEIKKPTGSKGIKKTLKGTLGKKSEILKDQPKSEVNDNFKSAPVAKRESPRNCKTSKSKQEVPTSVIADQKSQNGDIHRKSASRKEPSETRVKGNLSVKKNDLTDKDNKKHISQEDSGTSTADNVKIQTKRQTSSSRLLQSKTSNTSLTSKRGGIPENSEPPNKTKSITKKRKDKKGKQHQSTDPSQGPERGDPIKLWGYDMTPLIYVFKTAQFFLGLTIHDKVMEIANQYNST